jgi:hypothetical protein
MTRRAAILGFGSRFRVSYVLDDEEAISGGEDESLDRWRYIWERKDLVTHLLGQYKMGLAHV